jgi:hypothetical protein
VPSYPSFFYLSRVRYLLLVRSIVFRLPLHNFKIPLTVVLPFLFHPFAPSFIPYFFAFTPSNGASMILAIYYLYANISVFLPLAKKKKKKKKKAANFSPRCCGQGGVAPCSNSPRKPLLVLDAVFFHTAVLATTGVVLIGSATCNTQRLMVTQHCSGAATSSGATRDASTIHNGGTRSAKQSTAQHSLMRCLHLGFQCATFAHRRSTV